MKVPFIYWTDMYTAEEIAKQNGKVPKAYKAPKPAELVMTGPQEVAYLRRRIAELQSQQTFLVQLGV
jgi:hypothetical protein